MKKNWIGKLIILAIVIVMLIPIVYEMVIGSTLRTIKYAKLEDTKVESASQYGFGFSAVYVAPSSDKATKENKKSIKVSSEDVKSPVTNEAVQVYFMDYDKLSDSEKKEIFGDSSEKTAYIFYVNGELLNTIYGELEINNLKTYLSTYSAEKMSPNLTEYKVFEDSAAFKKAIKRKNDVTMAVFGRDTCFYCNQFKTVYNQVAIEEKLDIYYFDEGSYDADEFKKVKDSNLTIPKACTDGTKDENLKDYAYDTPLTLFIKNGKVIDCISGYVGKSELVTKLQTVGMIKTEDTEKKDN